MLFMSLQKYNLLIAVQVLNNIFKNAFLIMYQL